MSSFNAVKMHTHTHIHKDHSIEHRDAELIRWCNYTALAAAQCIVIGPVYGCVCVGVGGPVTTITRNCVHRSSPNWVCR